MVRCVFFPWNELLPCCLFDPLQGNKLPLGPASPTHQMHSGGLSGAEDGTFDKAVRNSDVDQA